MKSPSRQQAKTEGEIEGGGTRRALEWRLHNGCNGTRRSGVRAAREAKATATLALLRAVYAAVRWSSPVEVAITQMSVVTFRRVEASESSVHLGPTELPEQMSNPEPVVLNSRRRQLGAALTSRLTDSVRPRADSRQVVLIAAIEIRALARSWVTHGTKVQ